MLLPLLPLLLVAGAAELNHLRVWPEGLDECCAPKAVAALVELPGVASVALDVADASLCLGLSVPAPELLPALSEALAAVSFPLGKSEAVPACPAVVVADPWAGATGMDFAKIPSDSTFSMKDKLAPGKVTLVEFGAAWCAPCHVVAAALTEALRTDAGLAVRAVQLAGDDAAAAFATPAARQHLSSAPGIPWILVYNAKGRRVYAGEDPVAALAAARLAR